MEQEKTENIASEPLKKKSGFRAAFVPGLISMVLLWLSQEPVGFSVCSWFALVPWTISCVRSQKYLTSAASNLLCGFIYYLASVYWLTNVTAPGTAGLALYLSLYFIATGFILKRIYVSSKWPFTFTLPVIWVCHEYLRSIVMTGFPWLFISHNLHNYSKLTQIADITGAYGVTFIAVMVNGFIIDLLLRPQVALNKDGKKINLFLRRAFTLAMIITCAMLYGSFRLNESAKTMTPGPVVSVIQDTVPQHVKDSGSSSQDILASHMAISQNAAQDKLKPELIIWPETMVLYDINQEYMELAKDADLFTDDFTAILKENEQVNQQLSELASDNNAYLLVGTPAEMLEFNDDKSALVDNGRSNAAILYNSDGSRTQPRYEKMHRVPFGEYLPFKESIPWLNKFLINLTPYKYDYSIRAGSKPVAFKMTAKDGKEYKFTVAICYEDVIPGVARKLANWEDADFMLNISNDGWFVNDTDGKINPSSELMQHMAICRYRAIENRIGIARSVNCGISGMIKPDGTLQTSSGSLPTDDIKARRGVSGYLNDTVWLDSRKSIYSKAGDFFAIACSVITLLIFIVTLRKSNSAANTN